MKKMHLAFSAGAVGLLVSGAAHATGPIDTLFTGVDLSSVSTNVTTIGGVVLAIALTFKGIDLVKRAVTKV